MTEDGAFEAWVAGWQRTYDDDEGRDRMVSRAAWREAWRLATERAAQVADAHSTDCVNRAKYFDRNTPEWIKCYARSDEALTIAAAIRGRDGG